MPFRFATDVLHAGGGETTADQEEAYLPIADYQLLPYIAIAGDAIS